MYDIIITIAAIIITSGGRTNLPTCPRAHPPAYPWLSLDHGPPQNMILLRV